MIKNLRLMLADFSFIVRDLNPFFVRRETMTIHYENESIFEIVSTFFKNRIRQ